MSQLQVIDRIIALLSDERCWTKGYSRRSMPLAGGGKQISYCISGAISEAVYLEGCLKATSEEIALTIAESIDPSFLNPDYIDSKSIIVGFNDLPFTKHTDVMNLLSNVRKRILEAKHE